MHVYEHVFACWSGHLCWLSFRLDAGSCCNALSFVGLASLCAMQGLAALLIFTCTLLKTAAAQNGNGAEFDHPSFHNPKYATHPRTAQIRQTSTQYGGFMKLSMPARPTLGAQCSACTYNFSAHDADVPWLRWAYNWNGSWSPLDTSEIALDRTTRCDLYIFVAQWLTVHHTCTWFVGFSPMIE